MLPNRLASSIWDRAHRLYRDGIVYLDNNGEVKYQICPSKRYYTNHEELIRQQRAMLRGIVMLYESTPFALKINWVTVLDLSRYLLECKDPQVLQFTKVHLGEKFRQMYTWMSGSTVELRLKELGSTPDGKSWISRGMSMPAIAAKITEAAEGIRTMEHILESCNFPSGSTDATFHVMHRDQSASSMVHPLEIESGEVENSTEHIKRKNRQSLFQNSNEKNSRGKPSVEGNFSSCSENSSSDSFYANKSAAYRPLVEAITTIIRKETTLYWPLEKLPLRLLLSILTISQYKIIEIYHTAAEELFLAPLGVSRDVLARLCIRRLYQNRKDLNSISDLKIEFVKPFIALSRHIERFVAFKYSDLFREELENNATKQYGNKIKSFQVVFILKQINTNLRRNIKRLYNAADCEEHSKSDDNLLVNALALSRSLPNDNGSQNIIEDIIEEQKADKKNERISKDQASYSFEEAWKILINRLCTLSAVDGISPSDPTTMFGATRSHKRLNAIKPSANSNRINIDNDVCSPSRADDLLKIQQEVNDLMALPSLTESMQPRVDAWWYDPDDDTNLGNSSKSGKRSKLSDSVLPLSLPESEKKFGDLMMNSNEKEKSQISKSKKCDYEDAEDSNVDNISLSHSILLNNEIPKRKQPSTLHTSSSNISDGELSQRTKEYLVAAAAAAAVDSDSDEERFRMKQRLVDDLETEKILREQQSDKKRSGKNKKHKRK